jgi:hypothetical protein
MQFELTKLITAWTWGKPPPSLLLCASPQDPHPNGFLSQDSQVGISKLQKLGLSQFWGLITLCAGLWLRWDLKQSCSLCPKISNSMSHTTCTQGNRVNFWLLVVGSQIVNLTPGPSFGHNVFQMSKWVMQAYFRHLRFNIFPMV